MSASPPSPAAAGSRKRDGSPRPEPRSRPIALRIGADDLATLDREAKARGLTRSGAMRRLIRQAFGLLDLDPNLVKEMRETNRLILAIGNNLNQLTRSSYRGGVIWTDADADDVAATQREIRRLNGDLTEVFAALNAQAGGRARVSLASEED